MLSRIVNRALLSGRLQKVALQATCSQSTAAKPELVIRSNLKPSGNIPHSLDYDQIPVKVDGEEIVVTDSRILQNPWPLVPTISEETAEEGKEDQFLDQQSLEDEISVWFGHEMPTILDDLKPERDVVNFPRLDYRQENAPEVRMALIPESYFQFFREKTGVTGPYVFIGSVGTFMLSKEWFHLGDEAYNAFILAAIVGYAAKNFGGKLNRITMASELKRNQGWLDWQVGMTKFLEEVIAKYKEAQETSVDQSILINAKRENVALQREAEYRRRQMVAFNEVKRKLDYHVAIESAQKQFEQNHLVNWVIESVNNSITPEVQTAFLQQSLVDLKALSQKRKNAF